VISNAGKNLIFIIGQPRSGTTLLSLILGNAPGVHCPSELWLALKATELLRTMKSLHQEGSSDVLQTMALEENLSAAERAALCTEYMVSAYNRVLSHAPGCAILIDKTPRYYGIIPELSRLLPDARFLLVSRNPLDVAASHKSTWGLDIQALSTHEGLSDASFDIYCAPALLASARRAGAQDRFYWLQYEALVRKPSETIAGICKFTGLSFSDAMLKFDSSGALLARHATSNLGDKSVFSRDAISGNTINRWKRDLTETEVKLVCSIVGPDVFDDLDYTIPQLYTHDRDTFEFLMDAYISRLCGAGNNVFTMNEPREVWTLRANTSRTERELADLREHTRLAEARIADLESGNDLKAADLDALCKENAALHQQLSVMDEIRNSLHESESKLAAAGDDNINLRSKLEQMDGMLAEQQAENDKLQQQLVAENLLRYELRDVTDKLSTARERLEKLHYLWPWIPETPSRNVDPIRISIVTPSFNQAKWIEANILSVLEQNYPNFEHIIVDGGSTDGTREIVWRYPHVRFVHEPDLGQTHAINKGILMSSGDIIAYLNSDDVYRPGCFKKIAGLLSGPSGPKLVFGSCDYIDEAGRMVGHMNARLENYWDLQRYWGWERWYCIPQQSVFWRRELLSETGLFDVRHQYTMDYEMWLRMVAICKPLILDDTLAAFRLQPESKTVAETANLHLDHRVAARRHWPSYWRPSRWYLETGSLFYTANSLLNIAEHEALEYNCPGRPLKLILRALTYWPPVLLDPRFILTITTAVTSRSILKKPVSFIHRGYCAARWWMFNKILGQ